VDVGSTAPEDVVEAVGRARELAEETLGLLARVALEEVHRGLEAGAHLEAAERDLRGSVRQLVLAERDLRSRAQDAEPDEVSELLAGLA
jgi:hypothetical protein